MPRLWTETVAAHRRAVREAILDAADALVAEHGLASVTMSRVAEAAGIGRATLYRYFPDVDAVLRAWHERRVAAHVEHLTELRDRGGDPDERLAAVLEGYALICHHHDQHSTEIAVSLHQGAHVARARRQLHALVRELLAEVAEAGGLRDDVSVDELASYCLNALSAAGDLPSTAAARRLAAVTRDGLRPR